MAAVDSSLEIDCVLAYQIQLTQKTAAAYVFEIKNEINVIRCTKTYREVRLLHEKLQKKHIKTINFPPFPSRTIFKANEAEIEKRRLLFSRYFHSIVQYPEIQKDEDFRSFFQISVLQQKSSSTVPSNVGKEEEEDGSDRRRRRGVCLRQTISSMSMLPIKNIADHVKLLQKPLVGDEESNGFQREFLYIEERSNLGRLSADYSSSQAQFNIPKNRYINVLPPENTRVRLQLVASDPRTDYINANHISKLTPMGTSTYIATQGPLPNTFNDFWRMVWQYKSSVIVMLTKEREGDRVKCDRYWPEGTKPVEYGDYLIDPVDVVRSPGLDVRTFNISHRKTKELRQVVQFQYIEWPDHGVPSSTEAFLNIVDSVNAKNTLNGPIIAHCSAGIGRSGVFCLVHAVLEQFKVDIREQGIETPALSNVADIVLKLRTQRTGMVQTSDQYMFCYMAILEAMERLRFNTLSDILGGNLSSI
eukprot:TRINITY_DN7671_c0_g1_i1.p1 TRINITY_DN7671_c0_g1~~TRINITY_DN7671_c0_g1_i1.p1  ORF type:complete len:543 (-),score=127.26 TRINITY_DN7671_c0_g1_i1:41-1462(-)